MPNNSVKMVLETERLLTKNSKQQKTSAAVMLRTSLLLFFQQKLQGLKTLPPHMAKEIPGGHIQRTGTGLRTIPPQRPSKIPARPNYIGKHAIQAQKIKNMPGARMRTIKTPTSVYGGHHNRFMQNNPVTFTQALTAEIIETLSSQESSGPTSGAFGFNKNSYEPPSVKFESSNIGFNENKEVV